MWSCSRRRLLATLAALTLPAGCGFSPVHGRNGGAQELNGRVRVQFARGRTGYYLVDTLRQRLGEPDSDADLTLGVNIEINTRDVVVGERDEILRYEVLLKADYELRRDGVEEPLAEGEVEVATSVDATGSPYAAYVAERNRIRAAAVEAASRVLRDIYLRLALTES